MECVSQFTRGEVILKSAYHIFLTLIPKTPTASKMGDFRSISCVNLIYKLMTKILADRLGTVSSELISPNQQPSFKADLSQITQYFLMRWSMDLGESEPSKDVVLALTSKRHLTQSNRRQLYPPLKHA